MEQARQKKIDYTDPLSQYKSGKTAKVVTQRELDEKKAKLESSHQLEFCKWLKHLPGNYMYFSDISSGTKKSGYMQNISSILKSDDKFPDVFIFHPVNGYVGCMIEIKRIDSGAILKDGTLSKANHIQEQNKCHERLRQMRWYVTFAEGAEEAKRKFLEYINPPLKKKSRCCGRCDGFHDICVADMVCENHKEMGCEICYGER